MGPDTWSVPVTRTSSSDREYIPGRQYVSSLSLANQFRGLNYINRLIGRVWGLAFFPVAKKSCVMHPVFGLKICFDITAALARFQQVLSMRPHLDHDHLDPSLVVFVINSECF